MDVEVKCEGCGADLIYKPGTRGLTCNYCSHFMAFSEAETVNEAHKELDLEEYLASFVDQSQHIEKHVVSCKECGAETELEENQQSGACPFCETPLIVAQAHSKVFIRPKGLLPFAIEKKQASENFKTWLGKLWFAPSALKKQAARFDKMKGIYLPFWTYDCSTFSRYTGQRGDHYTETVPAKDSNGNSTTRSIQRTRWHSVSGTLDHNFDDVLIPATKSLPQDKLDLLAPWDLKNLVDYKSEYLAGYITESYQTDLKASYQQAKKIMEEHIRDRVRQKIGGDVQNITALNTHYSSATFKHVLLPVWVSAYHYQSKLYQIIVNARTGEVQGERPWSWLKIISLVILIIAAVGSGFYLVGLDSAREAYQSR